MTRSVFLDQCLLVIVALLLYLPFLGSNVLWDFDEGYFASVAKEMFEKGEWIVPTFNENELGDKPILIFWGMIISFSIFGVSEFAVRFPSILYGTATVLLTYHLARRLFQNRAIAVRAAFVLATMLLFVVETRGTTCDGAMICWLTAAMTVYVYGCKGFQIGVAKQNNTENNVIECNPLTEQSANWFPQKQSVVVLLYACLGVATLAKGPASFVMGTTVIGLFLFVKTFFGQINHNLFTWITTFLKVCWTMRPLTAIVVVLIVAGPWFLAVGYKTDWEWTKMFFVEHNFQRTISPTRGHIGFLLFYFITSLFGTFPWSIFLIPVSIDLFRRLRQNTEPNEPKNAYYFVVCWTLLYYGFFSLVSTKLPHYVVPAYPAIALIVGAYLYYWRDGDDLAARFWTPICISVLTVTGLGIIVVMEIVLPKYFPDEKLAGVVVGSLPLLMGVIGFVVYWKRGRKGLDTVYLLLAILFVPVLFQWAAARISNYAVHRNGFFDSVVASADANETSAPPLLVVVEVDDAPSWFFYAGQPKRIVSIKQLEEYNAEQRKPTAAGLVKSLQQKLIEQEKWRPQYFANAGNESYQRFSEGELYFVTDDKNCEKIKRMFGESIKEIKRSRRFMKKYDIVLLKVSELTN